MLGACLVHIVFNLKPEVPGSSRFLCFELNIDAYVRILARAYTDSGRPKCRFFVVEQFRVLFQS
jgi:hypothetical protein